MFSCPNCGGNVKFDISSQKLACDYCHEQFDPYSFEDKKSDAEETPSYESDYEVTIFTCPQCGGEILSTDNAAAGFCSFCGASTILYSRISHEKRPNFIIPFKKTKEDCKQSYLEMMKHAIFAPKELKDPKYIDSFRGIYMPYWAFHITQQGAMHLPAHKSYRRGDYVYKDHYNLEGDLDAYYKGLSYDASSSFDDSISETLAPYDLKGMKAFTPAFLSGFYADTADVAPSVYQPLAETTANEESVRQIQKTPAFAGYQIDQEKLSSSLGTQTKTVDSSMFPVWFMSYRKNGRVAYVTVNGQTGKIAADIPIAPGKYILGSLLLSLPLFLILMFFTILPKTLVGITIGLAILSLILYASEISKIRKKDSGSEDRGRLYKKGIRVQEEPKQKEKSSGSGSVVSIIVSLATASVLFSILIPLAPSFRRLGTAGTLIMVGFVALVLLLTLLPAILAAVKSAKKARTQAADIESQLAAEYETRSVLGYIMPIFATIVGALVLIIKPVSDLYYYGAAFLGLIAVGFSIWDIIRHYNVLATRRLPQFNKQGGDDNA